MEIDGKPNQRACRVPVHEGLSARSQNAWPSVDHDILRVIERFDRMLPIGFYYKTLYKPRLLWRVAEPIIRRLAGLGRVSKKASTEEYEHRYEHVDVLVVGGGPPVSKQQDMPPAPALQCSWSTLNLDLAVTCATRPGLTNTKELRAQDTKRRALWIRPFVKLAT